MRMIELCPFTMVEHKGMGMKICGQSSNVTVTIKKGTRTKSYSDSS